MIKVNAELPLVRRSRTNHVRDPLPTLRVAGLFQRVANVEG